MNLGVVGGGQLGRMLALAGIPLGVSFHFLDTRPDACAFAVGDGYCGSWDDLDLLGRFMQNLDGVTYEFENVSVEGIRFLSERVPVHPNPEALQVKRDRLLEKKLYQDLGIPTAPFLALSSPLDLDGAVERLGLPLVVKTREHGYDGKGVWILRSRGEVEEFRSRFPDAPLLAEAFVNFRRELSLIGVRGRDGSTVFYPLAENVHRDGILVLSRSRPEDPRWQEARSFVQKMLEHFDYVGVLALEMFETSDGLLANEFAPRVHNTGHWTIEGAETSQFENHIRAVLGFPLGDPSPRGFALMVNCIGSIPSAEKVLAIPGAHLHVYGKQPRPGRKIGHVTLRADSEEALMDRTRRLFEDLATWEDRPSLPEGWV